MSERLQQVGALLIAFTGAGLSLPDACAKAEVSLSTVKGWLARGRREASGPYREFVNGIDAARDVREIMAEPPGSSSGMWEQIDALAARRAQWDSA